MRPSRFGIIVLLAITAFLSANCSYYTRIMSRKNLVDGSHAYKERKFAEAEELFRRAAARDPEGTTVEGRTAQLFLARTLHSRYIGSRNPIFGESDFLGDDQMALAKKLEAKSDPVSQYLAGPFPDTQALYNQYKSLNPQALDTEGIKQKYELGRRFLRAMANDLNKLLSGGQSSTHRAILRT